MKIEEFINKYLNKIVDFDGAFGAQCVDVFRQYCKDVLEIPHTGAVEGAKDLFPSAQNTTDMGMPKKVVPQKDVQKVAKEVFGKTLSSSAIESGFASKLNKIYVASWNFLIS